MTLLFILILFLVALFAPLKVQLVLFIINLIIPDPIPFIDEIIQLAFIIRKMIKG